VTDEYRGPLRQEPLAIELYNTLYAIRGEMRDGLAEPESAISFLRALGPRLDPRQPPDPCEVPLGELVALRETIRSALRAVIDGRRPEVDILERLNRTAVRAPMSWRAEARGDDWPIAVVYRHDASPGDIVLAAFAADAIGLVASCGRDKLRACTAPGCVLVYSQEDPRRQWCSNACGNRARQARHYLRSHGRKEPGSNRDDQEGG
jgi:predicted RNA-binding Zn ribbon-like protein